MTYCACSRCDHELHVHLKSYDPHCQCRSCT